jgi:ribosome biogenesis protein Nip4
MSITYYKSNNVLVEEIPNLQAAKITFTGSLKSEEYRKAMEKAYELCKNPNIKNWLQNNQQAGVLSVEDQHWVSNDLIPRASSYVDKIAVVVSVDVFRKFAAKNILEKERGKLNFQYFETLPDAENWLKD